MLLWLFINKLHRHSSVEYRRQRYINNSFREYLCKEFDKEKDMRYSLLFNLLPSPLLFLLSFYLLSFCHYVFSISTFRLSSLLSFYLLSIMSLCLLSLLSLCLPPIILSSVLLSWFANMNYFRYLCLQNKRKNKWQQ